MRRVPTECDTQTWCVIDQEPTEPDGVFSSTEMLDVTTPFELRLTLKLELRARMTEAYRTGSATR